MKTSIGVKVGLVILNVHSRKRAQRFGSLTRISKLMSPLFNIQQFHVGLNRFWNLRADWRTVAHIQECVLEEVSLKHLHSCV